MTRRNYFTVAIIAALIWAPNLRAENAKTYKVDDEGFVRNWLVLGPISVDQKVREHTEDAEHRSAQTEWTQPTPHDWLVRDQDRREQA